MLYPKFAKNRELRISQSKEVFDNLEGKVKATSPKDIFQGCCIFHFGLLIIGFVVLVMELFIVIFLFAVYRDFASGTITSQNILGDLFTFVMVMMVGGLTGGFFLKYWQDVNLLKNYRFAVQEIYSKLISEGEIIAGNVETINQSKKYYLIEYSFLSSTGETIHGSYTTRRDISIEVGDMISVLYLDDEIYTLI